MAVPSPQRLDFEPDNILTAVASSPDEAPALSSSRALARFEFESGKGNEGTKILMVEWSDPDGSNNMGDWEVSWEGKTTVLSARDGAEGKLHRLYFLLAPGANIPRIVKLSQAGSGEKIQTNPLPAIFPPELGLEMAMQEKQWIEDNFGVGPKVVPDLPNTTSPTSPKVPGSGRLSEKLKGLKLGTSASQLGPSGVYFGLREINLTEHYR
jgi:hypothetical protein